jgi:hypothetical protein
MSLSSSSQPPRPPRKIRTPLRRLCSVQLTIRGLLRRYRPRSSCPPRPRPPCGSEDAASTSLLCGTRSASCCV